MTLTKMFKKGIADRLGNFILIRLHQIGTAPKLWNASEITRFGGRSARFARSRP